MSMQFESIDNTYDYGTVANIKEAMRLASDGKMQGFKIYNSFGHFIREYALFDGRYRKVANDGETI
jgi:hypothetical protein